MGEAFLFPWGWGSIGWAFCTTILPPLLFIPLSLSPPVPLCLHPSLPPCVPPHPLPSNLAHNNDNNKQHFTFGFCQYLSRPAFYLPSPPFKILRALAGILATEISGARC